MIHQSAHRLILIHPFARIDFLIHRMVRAPTHPPLRWSALYLWGLDCVQTHLLQQHLKMPTCTRPSPRVKRHSHRTGHAESAGGAAVVSAHRRRTRGW
eukprot:COSAG01_NODE_1309_length_10793_cov_10.360483_7_plen_98_part_00